MIYNVAIIVSCILQSMYVYILYVCMHIGEGNGTPLQHSCLGYPMDRGAWWAAVHGNPLQCSCLENPRDRGASWAAVYGVAQSRTQLKRLSSSSSPWIFDFSLLESLFWSQKCPSMEGSIFQFYWSYFLDLIPSWEKQSAFQWRSLLQKIMGTDSTGYSKGSW